MSEPWMVRAAVVLGAIVLVDAVLAFLVIPRLRCLLGRHSDGWIRERGAWRCVECRRQMQP